MNHNHIGNEYMNCEYLSYHNEGKPVFAGIPKINSFWVETNEPGGPFGAKSIGEAAMNPAATAIANAVYNAVGVRIKRPSTHTRKDTKDVRREKERPVRNY